ncbi:hypothetical protein HID58_031364 [Brassica napus]|uniref:Uncharacterized protein n=1 Tax=Brassica napus TaxID=3708 RepID=A0ABQ7XIN7_BRANA|nr:hypothetical protein HID58_031364 [Brassica napus]
MFRWRSTSLRLSSGRKSFPLASDVWNKLLELPLRSRWPRDRVHQACQLFAQSNGNTRHLAKLLIHLSWCCKSFSKLLLMMMMMMLTLSL